MGRGETWDAHGSGSQYWRGAYSIANRAPWKPSGKGKEKGTHQAHAFPAYDQRPMPKTKVKATRGELPGASSSDTQRALNAARKAENKLSKLQNDRNTMAELWQQYLVDHKEAYLRERARHIKAMEASARDIEDAKRAQWEAREAVRATVLQEMTQAEPAEPVVDTEWEEMLQGWEEEQRGHLDGVLRRALQEKSAPPGRPEYAQMEVDTAPPGLTDGHSMGLQTEGPGHYVERSPRTPARFDPYQASSPVTTLPHTTEAAAPERRTSPVHPGQRDPNATRIPTSEGAPRPSIKSATSAPSSVAKAPPGGINLADKLHHKRMVMEPFGGSGHPPARPADAPPVQTEAEIALAEAKARLTAAPAGHQTPVEEPVAAPTPLPATFLEDDDLDLT